MVLPCSTGLLPHICVVVINAMSSRQAPAAVTAIAAVAGGVLLTLFLVQRRRDQESKQQHDNVKTTSPNGKTTPDSGHQRRLTLEELLQDGDLTVKPIGTVRSIYKLCVGTPRQGLLAPHARGRLELDGVSHDAVLELDGFSHVWVTFVFHLNTVSKNQRVPTKTKIAPPALGGKKVGVLATRSPHRPNPVGMTLCKLESITLPSKNSPTTVLNVSGLDLVDGTPILDIKPYVPHYDSVPSEEVRLPPWVSEGLATRRPVHIESSALNELEAILVENPNALDFYGSSRGDESMEATMKQATHCIAEVLSIDVRSKWQTNKARDGNFQAERAGRLRDTLPEDCAAVSDSEQCTQQLDNLLVYYTVQAPDHHERSASEGSGAEDIVHVNSIQLLTGGSSSSSKTKTVVVADDDAGASKDTDASPPVRKAEETPLPVKPPGKATEAEAKASPTGAPPTDADYKSLKNYWSQAASRNTPTGLVPEEGLNRQRSQKFFSAKSAPVTPDRKSHAPLEDKSTPSSGAATIHPTGDDEVPAADVSATSSQESLEA
jgi:tRNA-Thr(GGU) m(6)t(6)A37 methyltransferase TsaA